MSHTPIQAGGTRAADRGQPTPDPDSQTPELNWALLVAREPRLGQLLTEIRAVGARRGFCANAAWFGYRAGGRGFKWRKRQLVGWEREGDDPILGTREAYELAYGVLYEA